MVGLRAGFPHRFHFLPCRRRACRAELKSCFFQRAQQVLAKRRVQGVLMRQRERFRRQAVRLRGWFAPTAEPPTRRSGSKPSGRRQASSHECTISYFLLCSSQTREKTALTNAWKPHLVTFAQQGRHDETRLLQRQKRRRWAAIARNVREEEARRRWRIERNNLRARSGTTERSRNGERRSVRAPFAKKTLAGALRLSAVSDLVTDLPGVVR